MLKLSIWLVREKFILLSLFLYGFESEWWGFGELLSLVGV